MDFIKKNLVFCLTIAVCLLAAAAGGYLAFTESGNIDSAKKQISSAEAKLSSLLSANPAPSVENLAAAEQNVADLTAQLRGIRENLEKGSRINTSSDGVGVMSSIQQFINDFQGRVESVVDEKGNAKPIEVPDNFAFGFDKYIDEGEPLSDSEVNTALDKQRQILSFILNKLIESNVAGITAVQREIIEDSADTSGFEIDPVISKRVPGAVDTMAFSVTFTGYTVALRNFLNELAKFELPIVVTNIDVDRPTSGARNAAPAVIDFGFGFGSESDVEDASPDQVEVVSENESSFTVVLEFIDIVLPSNEK